MIFSAPMVRALLAGTKTQTRRLMKPQPEAVPPEALGERPAGSLWWACNAVRAMVHLAEMAPGAIFEGVAPFHVGQHLWVRETWSPVERESDRVDGIHFSADAAFVPIANTRAAADAWIDAANNDHSGRWRSPLFMPRWASRITLEVTSVRVERLQQITEDGAKAEGVAPAWLDVDGERVHAESPPTYRQGYACTWAEIHGDKEGRRWADDPFVWVVSFRRIEASSEAA